MNTGFILLYRQITEWEWYQNPNTFRVFLHCLLMANFVDGRFEGKDIKRGQFVTSLPSLAKQTCLSIQQVRTALEHLKSTGEITDKGYTKYRVITIVKYDAYQCDNRQDNNQITDNQQTNNRQVTDNQQQYKNNNKEIKKKGNNHQSILFIPPTVEEVERYCDEKGIFGFDAQHFVDYYESVGWMIGKQKMKDWKAAIRNWVTRDRKKREQERINYDDLPM